MTSFFFFQNGLYVIALHGSIFVDNLSWADYLNHSRSAILFPFKFEAASSITK